jgi:hypothetical protein
MKLWVAVLLFVISVLVAIIGLISLVHDCMGCIGWRAGNQEVDEENPPSRDEPREARVSESSGLLGITWYLLSLANMA